MTTPPQGNHARYATIEDLGLVRHELRADIEQVRAHTDEQFRDLHKALASKNQSAIIIVLGLISAAGTFATIWK